MIQVFIGTLIIQMLAGLAFKNYIQITFGWSPSGEIIYSLSFNGLLSLIVLILITIYFYMQKKHKGFFETIDMTLKSLFKYTIIVNIITILLAQSCLLYTNKAFVYFLPQQSGTPMVDQMLSLQQELLKKLGEQNKNQPIFPA